MLLHFFFFLPVFSRAYLALLNSSFIDTASGGSSYYNPSFISNFTFANAVNSGNGYVILTLGVSLSTASLVWSTPSGTVGSFNFNSVVNVNLVAYDSNANPLAYSLASGTLPLGVSLSTAAGVAVLSGSILTSETAVYTFVVTAASTVGNQSINRTFSMRVQKPLVTIAGITYYQTGTQQSITLTPSPSAVVAMSVLNSVNLTVTCVGAAGSTVYSSGAATFGYGGSVTGVYQNIPVGSSYYFVMGSQPTGATGGYPGGGLGRYTGAGGGGLSAFWSGTSNQIGRAHV